jgi:hypothetical protein
VSTFQINLVLQGGCVPWTSCHHLLKRLCKHSARSAMVLHTYPKPRILNAGFMCESVNTKYMLLPPWSDFVLLFKRASCFSCAQYLYYIMFSALFSKGNPFISLRSKGLVSACQFTVNYGASLLFLL